MYEHEGYKIERQRVCIKGDNLSDMKLSLPMNFYFDENSINLCRQSIKMDLKTVEFLLNFIVCCLSTFPTTYDYDFIQSAVNRVK